MYMRFAPVSRRGGEIRFAFSRVHVGLPSERVRLSHFRVQCYEGESVRAQWESYAVGVLANVAQPRRRMPTEATLAAIAAYLTSASGEEWRCVNEYRCTRRRRPASRRVYHTLSGEVCERRHIIHSYSHKPTPRFRVGGGEDASAVEYFGVELEIDQMRGRDSLDRMAVPDLAHPLFYCKEDGSLDNGVELVSHPGTMKWWNEQKGNVTTLLQQLSRLGWRSHETQTCGMHIHISQSAFENSMHMYRFLHLVYRFPALSLLVSQRNRQRLNQWATLSYNKKPALKYKAELPLKNREYNDAESGGHYDGVNKTSHTFELRIFNGTLNPARFYKNLQYAQALLRYTADTLNLRHVTAAKFTAWVTANAETYPDLAAFLADHASHAALHYKRPSKEGLAA